MKKFLTGLLSGVFNGLLGSGGGVVTVLALRKFFGVEVHRSHATAVAVMLPMTVVSAVIYLWGSEVDLMAALWVTIGGVAGGITGAHLLNKMPAKWLHKIFGAVMVFAAVRMVFA